MTRRYLLGLDFRWRDTGSLQLSAARYNQFHADSTWLFGGEVRTSNEPDRVTRLNQSLLLVGGTDGRRNPLPSFEFHADTAGAWDPCLGGVAAANAPSVDGPRAR